MVELLLQIREVFKCTQFKMHIAHMCLSDIRKLMQGVTALEFLFEEPVQA